MSQNEKEQKACHVAQESVNKWSKPDFKISVDNIQKFYKK